MSDARRPDNEELIDRLRAGLEESDPVPSDVTEFARAAFEWRDIDAELAEITFDSTSEGAMAGLRATTTARTISFRAGSWTIDIEYDESARRLIGQVDPIREVRVDIRFSGAVLATEADEMGRFDFEDVPPGPMSLVLRLPGDLEVVKTEWTVL